MCSLVKDCKVINFTTNNPKIVNIQLMCECSLCCSDVNNSRSCQGLVVDNFGNDFGDELALRSP